MHKGEQTTPPFGSALIVDDHPLFCDALSMTLSDSLGIPKVETAGTLGAALARLEQEPLPDVIALDLHLPDVNGLDGLIQLRGQVPQVPIIVVSSLTDRQVMRAALRAGVNGFVPKHSPREAFRTAFAAIARGEIHAPGFGPEDIRPAPEDDAVARLGQLTRQQMRILQLVCAGRMNKQIAYELDIAETTVKAHVTAIMRKLGVHSRMQAVLVAQGASFANLVPAA